jgi:C-5 cytosine-specific DNA methylase
MTTVTRVRTKKGGAPRRAHLPIHVPVSTYKLSSSLPLVFTATDIQNQENAQPVGESRTHVEKRKRQSVSTTQAFKKRGGATENDGDADSNSEAPLVLSASRARRTRMAPVRYTEDTDLESDESEEDPNFESEDQESTPMEEPMEIDDTDDEIYTRILPKTTKKRIAAEPKVIPATTNKSAFINKKKSASNKGDVSETKTEKLEKLHAKMEAERKDLKPQNNPQVMPEKPFVDPVGIDPTHGIIEGIIAEQVRKVGGLLKCVAERNEKGLMEKGELPFPIKLQTACSGTDAPSIALSLIQETLDHLYRDKSENNHGFSFSHEMSCEIEPFKQAYIGRNFPGVPLFPDITKLTVEDEVTDVYGRPQTIPKGNLFVAGTSCKDFSMLKSNLRLDIEDKGTSGQTFLAAVEFLEKFEPEVFIFENVDGAPWDKMQEYITGRIQLSRRDDTTAITSSKTKAGRYSVFGFPT